MISRRVSHGPLAPLRFSLLLLAMYCGSSAAWAEENAAKRSGAPPIFSETGPGVDGALAPQLPAAPAVLPGGTSTRVRSQIEAKLPRYTPPAVTDSAERESDAVKLPPIFVTAPKLKVPDETQVLSPDAFAALLRKLYPGASVPGQDPYRVEHGLPNYGRLEFEYERRNAQKASLNDFADLVDRAGDHAQARRLKKEIQRLSGSTYKDPLLDAMDRSVNGGRR